MSVNKVYIICGFLLPAFFSFIYYGRVNSLDPFVYTEAGDFYSYISLDSSSGGQRKMVVPFGVFSIEKEGAWLQVARMDVSIVECDMADGKLNEGTVYKDRVEYWALNTKDRRVYGPMNKKENHQFLLENSLKGKTVKAPKTYSKYLNDFNSACGE